MRSARLLFAFFLGASAMLAAVIAAGWRSPGRPAAPRGDEGTIASPTHGAPPIAAPAAFGTADTAVAPSLGTPAVGLPPGEGLLIPVQGTLASSLVDTYEQARGEGRRHDAIDITAPRGTPVVASGDGVVMKLFQSKRGGITLYQLAPDQRTIYYYAHLDGYAPGIVEGRTLHRGEVLGYVGDTGDAGPGNYHLHFEVSTTADSKRYWGGVPQNPYPLLR